MLSEPIFDGAGEIPFESLNTLSVRCIVFLFSQTLFLISRMGIERDVWPREQLLPEECLLIRSPSRHHQERLQESVRAECGARERDPTFLLI